MEKIEGEKQVTEGQIRERKKVSVGRHSESENEQSSGDVLQSSEEL